MSVMVQSSPYNEDGQQVYEEGSFSFLHHKHYALEKTPVVMIEKFKGQVISEYERNYYDDSDFFAVIWDEEKQKPFSYQYASTRAWSYCNSAVVDATPDVLEKFNCYHKKIEELNREYKQELEKHIPKVGSFVKSLTTKGKAKGAEGIVEWIGSTPFSKKAVRINKNIFIDVERVEIWDDNLETWLKRAIALQKWNQWDLKEVHDKYFPPEK